jgi:hypothetical protein
MPTSRRTRKNPSSGTQVATSIIRNADEYGAFYEDVVQPRLVKWAKTAASSVIREKRVRPISAGVWTDIAQMWVVAHGRPLLSAAEAASAAEVLRQRFQPEADDYVGGAIDDILYP